MDIGPAHRRETILNRVSSPKAAKRCAELLGEAADCKLRLMSQVLADKPHLNAPARLVGREGLGAARERDLIEARFGNGEKHAVGGLLEFEGNQRGRLDGVIKAWLQGM